MIFMVDFKSASSANNAETKGTAFFPATYIREFVKINNISIDERLGTILGESIVISRQTAQEILGNRFGEFERLYEKTILDALLGKAGQLPARDGITDQNFKNDFIAAPNRITLTERAKAERIAKEQRERFA
jgi:hypothetical protein